MNGWEGQVLAIAVKELIEAAKTLGRDGFGFRKDKTLLSTVIRDLLTQTPNIPRAQATLKQVESLGAQPADYYVAKQLLAKVSGPPPLPAGEGWGEGGSPGIPHEPRSRCAKSPEVTEGGGAHRGSRASGDVREGRAPAFSRRRQSLLPRPLIRHPDHRKDPLSLSARDRTRPRPRDNS